MNIKELRTFNISNNETRKVSGYAIVFNSLSEDLGGFREIILPSSISYELLNQSDIIMNYSHDDNLILARSNRGTGTLTLKIDSRGLYFEFDMPKSSLGDQILESINRGDVTKCSFAFSLDEDDCERWERDKNNNIIRTITKITGLYDTSIVVHPAYSDTSVSKRALELAEQMRSKNNNQQDMKDIDIIKLAIDDEFESRSAEEEKEEQERQETSTEEEVRAEDSVEEDKEDKKEESSENEPEAQDEDEEEEKEEQERSINDKNKINSTIKMKEEKFSLIKAIRAIANNQEVDAVTKKVVELGAQEMRNSGLSFGGQIQIPVSAEKRDGVTVTGVHDDLIVTEFANILEPLQSRNVLVEAGATYIPNLVGDLQFPVMGAEQVGWAGEIEDAADGTGTWSHITLTPHRLTAYIDISKQFLAQDSLGAELVIRNQLVTALNTKLEATILSDVSAGGGRPAGLFYNSSVLDVSTFVDITELEASVEEENIYGIKKYIVSPKAKAALRAMPRSADCTRLVMENNEIDGTPALSTTHMDDYTLAYGDWSNVAIGQWGGIDLVVDPYTVARSGQVRIVINAFFDFKLLRDGAIVYGATPSA